MVRRSALAPAPWRRTVIVVLTSGAAAFLLVLAIMLGEIDRLIADTLSVGLRSQSVGTLTGPFALLYLNPNPWSQWAAGGHPADYLALYGGLELVLTLVASAFVFVWLRSTGPFLGVIVVLAAAAAVESIAVMASSGHLGSSASGAVALVLALAATVKWIMLVTALVMAGASSRARRAIRAPIGVLIRALFAQRLSFVLVGILGLLSLVPRSGLLEQLPDVERSWFDPDWPHAAIAAAVVVLVALALFVFGRHRAELPYVHLGVDARREPTAAAVMVWSVGPALAIVAAAVEALIWPRLHLVDLAPLGFFLALTMGPLVVSAAFRSRLLAWALPPVRPYRFSASDAQAGWLAGDALAGALVAVGGLGLVRSLSAPVLLATGGTDPGAAPAMAVALAASVFIATAAVPGVVLIGRIADGRAERRRTDDASTALDRLLYPSLVGTVGVRARAALIVAGLVAGVLPLVLMMVFPLTVPPWLGVAATTTLALGCWFTVISVMAAALQRSAPFRVFRWLKLRENPVFTLLVLVPILVAQLPTPARLHAVEVVAPAQGTGAVATRPSVSDAFTEWLHDPAAGACVLPAASGGGQVRPLLVIAAEGGGIRAAAWTSDVLAALASGGPCAERAALLSSGASGGSLGLTLFRGATAENAPAVSANAVGGSAALASATEGMLVGDLIGASTGVRVPSVGLDTGGSAQTAWRDRAALVQEQWSAARSPLSAPFDLTRQVPTGYVILNSTVVSPQCRAVISQLDLDPGGAADDQRRCDALDGLPASMDLITYFGTCPPSLSWATATLLSARFPVITPAGRIDRSTSADPTGTRCQDLRPLQLVDGGIIENTALGTVADLSPTLVSAIAAQNRAVARGGATVPTYVVPIVLWIENSSGADVQAAPPKVIPEGVAQWYSLGSPHELNAPSTYLQRLSGSFGDVCGGTIADPSMADCRDAQRAVELRVPGQVAVASLATTPSLEAPLGWELSRLSTRLLCDKLTRQLDSARMDAATTGSSARFPTLASVLRLVAPGSAVQADDVGSCAG